MNEKPIKAAISVSEMCRLLKISRSQFYWHVERGTFHTPLYMVKNRRPFFTASMAEENLKARATGVGVNGQYVIFYEKQTPKDSLASSSLKIDGKDGHGKLIANLKSLGLESVSAAQVKDALAECFPHGTLQHGDADVLRAVFRHLKRSDVA